MTEEQRLQMKTKFCVKYVDCKGLTFYKCFDRMYEAEEWARRNGSYVDLIEFPEIEFPGQNNKTQQDSITRSKKTQTKLKYVYCPRNYDMTVMDILNNRVDHLCGPLTMEKYLEIIERSTNKTEFEGKNNMDKRVGSLKQTA